MVVLPPFVDRTATRVSMYATGFALVLAWWSIVDLRQQRGERWWPHTTDRLLRATFTAITLVFVVDLGVRPPPTPPAPPAPATAVAAGAPAPTPTPPRVEFVHLGEELARLARSGPWDNASCQAIVDRHFAGWLVSADGHLFMRKDGQRLELASENGRLVVRTP